MKKAWYQRTPELIDDIRSALRECQPNLHLHIDDSGRALISGTFAVVDLNGRVLERYKISIELLSDYPRSLPVVCELAGRIPRDSDHHINPGSGTACVLLPDERWKRFPEGTPFRQYLEGPLRDFFLGQSLVFFGDPWPAGEWGHGPFGRREYYQELLGTEDSDQIDRFLFVLSKRNLKTHWDCPCGSGMRIRDCCQSKIEGLRGKIQPHVALDAREDFGLKISPYKGPRILFRKQYD